MRPLGFEPRRDGARAIEVQLERHPTEEPRGFDRGPMLGWNRRADDIAIFERESIDAPSERLHVARAYGGLPRGSRGTRHRELTILSPPGLLLLTLLLNLRLRSVVLL